MLGEASPLNFKTLKMYKQHVETGKKIGSEKCNEFFFFFFYIVTKFSLSSFFWHQLQDVLAMHGQARTILNVDVKIDLRRIGIYGLRTKGRVEKTFISISFVSFVMFSA